MCVGPEDVWSAQTCIDVRITCPIFDIILIEKRGVINRVINEQNRKSRVMSVAAKNQPYLIPCFSYS
jgi:hypothetical protein